MYAKLLWAPFICSILLSTTAHADALFTASKRPMTETLNFWELSLTSKVDVLTIDRLTVNRGCKLSASIKMPVTLKFGQTYTLSALDCDPIEVSIDTPSGSDTLTWVGNETGKLIANKYYLPFVAGNNIVGGQWATFITSLSDSIAVKSVTINKGNCQSLYRMAMQDVPSNQWILSFGQRIAISSNNCNPLAVTVDTDSGPIDFNWDN